MPALTAAGPALVHFFDFAQLNSVRTLPYLAEWARRYREAGLSDDRRCRRRASPSAPSRERGRRRAAARSGSSSRSRSTPSASSGAPTAARAGRASSSGASAARSPGPTSARANTSATEEAIQEELREIDALRDAARADGAAAPDRRPGATGDRPHPRALPRRLLGAALDAARTARSWRSTTRPAAPSRRSRARARSRSRSTASGRLVAVRPRPGLRPSPSTRPRGAQPRPPPHPGTADLVGQLRRRRTLDARPRANRGGAMITKTRLRRRPVDRRRALPRLLRRDPRPAPRREGPFEFWAGDTCFGIWEPAKMGMEFAPQKNAPPGPPRRRRRRRPRRAGSKGVEFIGETFDTGVCHMALFTDPDGNDLMLHHRYSPRD